MRSGFLRVTRSLSGILGASKSQSLLNEVWFPTLSIDEASKLIAESQSLLNEVWFPTIARYFNVLRKFCVAIPSK